MKNPQTKTFRVNLHGAAETAGDHSSDVACKSSDLTTTQPFGGSFEDLISSLDAESRIHAEPDGSFVFRDDSRGIQVDGMIYDVRGQIQYVELLGQCDLYTWSWLVQLLHIQRPLSYTVQDLSDGRFLPAAEFEAWISGL